MYINSKAPEYLEGIDFNKHYRPIEKDKERYTREIQEYREQKKAKDLQLLLVLASVMENSVNVDYDKLMEEYEREHTNDNSVTMQYYKIMEDMSTNPEYTNLIEVQAGTGKLKPMHNKVDVNIQIAVNIDFKL